MSSQVICQLPRAGLGNQLFPMLKAHVFAEINALPIHIIGYNQFKIGPWLRREKIKRNYQDYFYFQKNLVGEWLDKRKLKRQDDDVEEPALRPIDDQKNTSYLFSEIPHWNDYFQGLKEHRNTTTRILYNLLRPQIRKQLNALAAPCIGVHIRMGDFKKLGENEDFSKTGAKRTPEKYFIQVIESLRAMHGSELPVSVFTDGYRKELPDLFAMKNISMIEGNADVVDLLLLSKSKIIVTSAGSTFSYWSAFLSEAVVIMHPEHIHASLRPGEVNDLYYEGPMDVENELLIRNVKAIVC